MTAVDWREVPNSAIADIARTETARWRQALDWDTTASWAILEQGRAAGTLPGLVLRDDGGETAGWTFFLAHEDELEVGAFVANAPQATQALLDAVLRRDEANHADVVRFFSFPDAPDLNRALVSHGFEVQPFHYLELTPLTDSASCSEIIPWPAAARSATLDLFASAYGGENWRRPFAPHGRRVDWAHYLDSLIEGFACGRFLPSASFLAAADPTAGIGDVLGVLLATTLSPHTAHVAQVVVGPQAQGHGLGRALLTAACSGAGAAGFRRLTLLVGAENDRARQLYAAMGFIETATFISAARRQPRRSTIVALDAGGTRMRR